MVERFEQIIKKLNSVDFHDIPVKSFYVEHVEKLVVKIDYFLYIEDKRDYEEFVLIFSEIETLKFQEFIFTKEGDIEIASFDYKIENDCLVCKITFLTGFGLASIYLDIECRNIEIVKKESKSL
jgi:hypothetical protein